MYHKQTEISREYKQNGREKKIERVILIRKKYKTQNTHSCIDDIMVYIVSVGGWLA